MIQVEDLRKAYGTIQAVDGVTFAIEKGETFGLLGPNGAGKSTTILLLVGALAPDQGSIRLDGSPDPRRPEARRHIGIAPQALSLYKELSGEENLAFFGKLYGLRRAALRERVDWALAFAGLEERRRQRVEHYSGGMQRRLNLACALIHDPPVVFLDEPTVGIDPQSRSHIYESIERLQGEGRTILYTTHYMEEAQRLCDRVAILDHGRILALDTVPALLEAHGGNAVIEATFERPPAVPLPIDGALDGTHLRVESARPLEDVARLSGLGVRLESLHVERPSLETVFLALTGRSLRD